MTGTDTEELPFEIEEDLPDPNEEIEFGDEGEGEGEAEPSPSKEAAEKSEKPAPTISPKPKPSKSEQRIGQLTRKLRETEARLQQREAELQESVKRVGETERYGMQAVSATLTKTKDALIDKFRQAFEEGKTDEVTAVLQDLMQVDRQLDEANRYIKTEPAKPAQTATPTPSPSLPHPPAALQSWMNKVNYNELSYEDKQLVAAMATKLENEGYDFHRPDFYTQLDARLGGLIAMDTETEVEAAPAVQKKPVSAPVKPAVAGPSRRPVMAGQPAPTSKVTVSREAMNRLSHMGIDLADKEMRAAYLKYGKGVGG